jgi:hypothetical protein
MFIVLIFGICVSVSGSIAIAQANEPDATEVANIRAVIERQIEAFKRNDAEAAYALTTQSIQSVFSSPEVFIDTIKNGYEPVYRPQSYSFEQARLVEGTVFQPVRIVEPSGARSLAIYVMERQSDAGWRIEGVILMHEEGVEV